LGLTERKDMKKETKIIKCACCKKNDLDTAEIKHWLFPRSKKIFCCPVCRSVHASPESDISRFLDECADDEKQKVFTVYYVSGSDRYFNYCTGVIIHISDNGKNIFTTRQEVVDWIKSGKIFSTPDLTYSESVSFLLRRKGEHIYLDQFNGWTTSYEGARSFPSAKKARLYLKTVDGIDPREWMSIRCFTQFLMVSKE